MPSDARCVDGVPWGLLLVESSAAVGHHWDIPIDVTLASLVNATVLDDIHAGGHALVDPEIARAIAEVLQDAVDHGTGTRANLGRAVAGMTGTDRYHRQPWFAGSAREYTALVSVATADSQTPKVNREINGRLCKRVLGRTVTAPMRAEFIETFLDG
jgi:membrane peptidoglycan carboxypeptidase